MKKIALISDTHGFLGEDTKGHLRQADEIWHAGDIGSIAVLEELENITETRAVYGNIDDHTIRAALTEDLTFQCEGLKIFMTHIGGYPGRYNQRVKHILKELKPDIYICGHSHICKVMKDPKLGLLHMNPGACGHAGLHIIRTLLLFNCDNSEVKDLRVIELGRRGRVFG